MEAGGSWTELGCRLGVHTHAHLAPWGGRKMPSKVQEDSSGWEGILLPECLCSVQREEGEPEILSRLTFQPYKCSQCAGLGWRGVRMLFYKGEGEGCWAWTCHEETEV